MTLRNTIHLLKYIGDVDQPEHERGGFHEQTIQAARSALHHIERLRRRSNIPICVKDGNSTLRATDKKSP